jgi:hypothetical protein
MYDVGRDFGSLILLDSESEDDADSTEPLRFCRPWPLAFVAEDVEYI